jgi:hypothetical protein
LGLPGVRRKEKGRNDMKQRITKEHLKAAGVIVKKLEALEEKVIERTPWIFSDYLSMAREHVTRAIEIAEREAEDWRDDDSPQSERTFGVCPVVERTELIAAK